MFVRKSSAPWRRSLGFWLVLASVASIAAAGCGGADVRPPKWSFIAPAIIEPSCATASCHSKVAQRAGVILTPRDTAYNTLLTRQFVFPNNVADSELVHLIRAEGSQRMPPDFPLPEADIELIESWIMQGANPD
jgi:hypothetical protein